MLKQQNKTTVLIVGVIALLILPHILQYFGNAWVRIADTALLYVLLALGLNIVVGYAGLLDLGYVAFFAVGAYLFGLLASPHLTQNFPAIAGIMYASNYGTAHHTMGFLPGLKAFTAAVFGGIGNLAGAVVGGLLLGLIESIGSGYIGDLTGGVLGSQYTDIFAFIVLIIILTLRPSGLLGERVADRA